MENSTYITKGYNETARAKNSGQTRAWIKTFPGKDYDETIFDKTTRIDFVYVYVCARSVFIVGHACQLFTCQFFSNRYWKRETLSSDIHKMLK